MPGAREGAGADCGALLPAGGAKAAFAAFGFIQRVARFKDRADDGGDDELRNAFAVRDGLIDARLVVERDHDFAAVIGVNHADFVGRGKTALGCKPAAGVDEPGEARRNRRGDAGADEDGLDEQAAASLPEVKR